MRRITTAAMAFAVLAATPLTVEAAGSVNVTFVNPERYRDIGDRYAGRRSGVLKDVESYFDYLGERYLKDGRRGPKHRPRRPIRALALRIARCPHHARRDAATVQAAL